MSKKENKNSNNDTVNSESIVKELKGISEKLDKVLNEMNKEPRDAPITYKPNKCAKVAFAIGILFVSVAIIIVPNLFECNGTDKCKCLHCIISLIIAVAVICLFSFFVLREEKEDIRFAKLTELHDFRNFIKEIDSDEKNIEEDFKEMSLPQLTNEIKNESNTDSKNGGTLTINYNLPVLKTSKQKNLKAELLKNYMNAVVEI